MSESERAAQSAEEPDHAAAQRDPQAGASFATPGPVGPGGRLGPRGVLDLQRSAGNQLVIRLARALADPEPVCDRLTPGKPLDADVQSRLSRALAENFASVRVHDSSGDSDLEADMGARSRALSRAVLARDQTGADVPTQLRSAAGAAGVAQPIKDWAEGQSDWEVLVATRGKVEAAQIGDTLRLTGEPVLDVVVSADARDVVRREIRHRLMEMLYLIWYSYGNEIADAHKGADPVGDLVAVQAKLQTKLEPIHRAIRDGKPQEERFEYPGSTDRDQAIRDCAITVSQLIALGGAEGARTDPGKAHQDAKDAVPGLGEADWCGAFAFMELQKGGLLLPSGVLGTNPLVWTGPEKQGLGIDEFCAYRPELEVKIGDTWKKLLDYHKERGSMRKFQVLPASGTDYDQDTRSFEGGTLRRGQIASIDDLDVQPGDLVMIDRAKGTFGDHIAMCRAYDKATRKLWTIGGNEGAPRPVNVSGAWELNRNPAPKRVDGDAKQSRVYAIARLSLVDYEPHSYRKTGAAGPPSP